MGDRQKMLAEVISAVSNAPLVTLYAFLAWILYLSPPSAPLLIVITALFGTLLPMAIILLMRVRGTISDIYASDRRTRLKPFLAAIFCYLLGILVLLAIGAPRSVTALMACYFVNSLVMMLITLTWKISLHASGVAGPSTFFIYQLGPSMLPLLLIILPVAWARIRLGAHSRRQIIAGFLLTIALTWLQLAIYLP